MLKGLFPMLSETLQIEAGRALKQREDVNLCREAIRAYACSYDQFGLASFIDHLPARPGGDRMSWNDAAYLRTREEGLAIEQAHAADNAVCDRLSDEQYAELASQVMEQMDDDVRGLLSRRKSLRASQWIRSLVAERVRDYGLLPSDVMAEAL